MKLNQSMKTTMSLAAAMGTLALATSANAAVIFTEDFEGSTATTAGTFTTASGWESTDFTSAGQHNELNAGNWGNHLSGQIGDAFGVVLFAAGTMTADLGINFADNTDYTFSFDHFRRSDLAGGDVTAQIQTVGGTVLATADFAAITGTTASDIANRIVPTYSTSGGAEVGQEIRLVFIPTSGNQVGIDNISLDAVPEPTTTALLGLGGLALILRRRK